MDAEKLESMKYNELQKVAKQNGIKANMKLNKLRQALLDHFKKTVTQENQLSARNTAKPKSIQSKDPKTPTILRTPNAVKTPNTVKAVFSARKSTPKALNSARKSTPKALNSPKPAPKIPSRTPNVPEEAEPKIRRSTFEKVPTPELHRVKAPDAEQSRRSTSVVRTPQSAKKTGTGIKGQNELRTPKENENKTQIPRFAAFLAKRKQETESKSTPLTPGKMKDWKKIHERNFEKMESIDEYLKKKRKRNDDYAESVKKTKKILHDTLAMVDKLKSYKTPTAAATDNKKKSITKTPNKAPFKPSVLATKEMNLNFSENRKSPRTSSAVAKSFKPTVVSTTNINLNFSSPAPSKRSAGCAFNKSKTTPFKFNASLNNTLNGSMSAKRPTFDLHASLARPITWKSHKGKLKPLNGQTAFSNCSTSVKTPTTQTREDRKKLMAAKRSSAKFNTAMGRRGIQA